MEDYNVSQCSDFPPNGSITFSDPALDNYLMVPVSPSWTFTDDYSGVTPQCGYGGQITSQGGLELEYTASEQLPQAAAPTSSGTYTTYGVRGPLFTSQ